MRKLFAWSGITIGVLLTFFTVAMRAWLAFWPESLKVFYDANQDLAGSVACVMYAALGLSFVLVTASRLMERFHVE